MRFFFYGTLLDPDVRRLVFPHVHDRLRLYPAELRGFVRVKAVDGSYPVIKPTPAGKVHGAMAEGLDLPGLARAAHFEGAGYHPAVRRVHPHAEAPVDGPVRAWLFMPAAPRRQASAKPWHLAVWQRRQKPYALRQTRAWMTEFQIKGLAGADISWYGRRMLRRLAEESADLPDDDRAFRIDEAA